MKLHSYILFCIVFSCLYSASATADGKTYPATFCQRWTAPQNNGTVLRYSVTGRVGGTDQNNQPVSIGIVCPLIRDSLRSDILEVEVVGRCVNNNCPGQSTCTLRVERANTQAPNEIFNERRNLQLISPVSGGVGVLSARWGTIAVPDFNPQEDSVLRAHNYVLFCQIDRNTTLNMISIDERP